MGIITKCSLPLFIVGRTCLAPIFNSENQPKARCINSTNTTLTVEWDALNITEECRNELVAFPTLVYTVFFSDQMLNRPVSTQNILCI